MRRLRRSLVSTISHAYPDLDLVYLLDEILAACQECLRPTSLALALPFHPAFFRAMRQELSFR